MEVQHAREADEKRKTKSTLLQLNLPFGNAW
jgi:hypothetical protein